MHQLTITTPASSPGLLAEVCRALADAAINITDIDLVEDRRKAVIVLRAEPMGRAQRVLEDGGFTVELQQTLVIRLADEAGAIAPVTEKLKAQRINVRSMHVLQRRDNGQALIALHTNDNEAARTVLERILVEDE